MKVLRLNAITYKHSRGKLQEDLRKVLNKHNIDQVLCKLINPGLDISIAEELNEKLDIPQEYESLVDAINNAGIYQLWYG
jgi:hypothetical protein